MEPFRTTEKRVAVIGGGTGSFTLLSALKERTTQIAAIVNMVDDGGSTGVLRDELGVLPAGDIRQCMVALSDSPKLRELFNYRFEDGTFAGHAFGNIFLAALEKSCGSFAEAVEMAGEVLRINGTVIPATLDDARLVMEWLDPPVTLEGQLLISAQEYKYDPRQARLTLRPGASANPAAVAAIDQADMVVIAPGGLYTSLGPLLVIDGIGEALMRTNAKVVYVCNLVTKHGQTTGLTVVDHAGEIERFGGGKYLDVVLYNHQAPSGRLVDRYHDEGAYLVAVDPLKVRNRQDYQMIGGDFLGEMASPHSASEKLPVVRSLIRHNPQAVAQALMQLV